MRPEEEPDWQALVSSPFWPQFQAMLQTFKEQASLAVMRANTNDELRAAQGELRAYHSLLTIPERRAEMVKNAAENQAANRKQELERDADIANRRGTAGAAGPRGRLAALRDQLSGGGTGRG